MCYNYKEDKRMRGQIMSGVKITDLVEKMNLKNLTPDIDLTERYITVPEVNRPALQLTGYFEHFDSLFHLYSKHFHVHTLLL